MCEHPAWLPEMLVLDGDWETTLTRLYAIFEYDIKNGGLSCDGMPVWYDRRVLPDELHGYEEGFWHLVTKDQWVTHDGCRHKERLPDFQRGEKLPWLAPSVRYISESEVTYWQYEGKKGRVEIYVWLRDLDYVVVFVRREKRQGPVAFLTTAYHIDGDSTRRNLTKKYERRLY